MSDGTIGAPVTLTYQTRVGQVLTDASTVSLTVRKPDGTDETTKTLAGGQVVRDSVGTYRYTYTPVTAGHYVAVWASTGTAAGGLSYVFDISDPFSRLILSLDDAKQQLNITTSTYDDELSLYAEAVTAVIEHKIGPITGAVPAAVNLAARIIVQHLWGTQQGGSAPFSRGGNAATDMTTIAAGYAIPNRALELLAPYIDAYNAGTGGGNVAAGVGSPRFTFPTDTFWTSADDVFVTG